MGIFQKINKVNKLILLLMFLIGCSSTEMDSSNAFGDRWISTDGIHCDIWFQNWVDYERLFITLYLDTVSVEPSAYVTDTNDKPYLKPKIKNVVNTQQLIGNITWYEPPTWDSGYKNEFTWVVDRANPKKLLPMSFKGSAYLENEKLKLDIELSGEPYLSVTAENMSYK